MTWNILTVTAKCSKCGRIETMPENNMAECICEDPGIDEEVD